jgi:hypothetical protein
VGDLIVCFDLGCSVVRVRNDTVKRFHCLGWVSPNSGDLVGTPDYYDKYMLLLFESEEVAEWW